MSSVTAEEQLSADLDTAAIALRMLAPDCQRLKLEAIADRVTAHAVAVLSGKVTMNAVHDRLRTGMNGATIVVGH